jgi:hypothetical protein
MWGVTAQGSTPISIACSFYLCASSWHIMAGVSYFNIKRSGEILGEYPKYSAYMLGGMHELSTRDMMRDAKRHMDGIFMILAFF